MKRVVLTCCIILGLLFFVLPLQAAEVLIVTWRGKTDAEEGFQTRLKKLHPDVRFRHLDADRNKTQLSTFLRNIDFSKFDLIYSYGTTGTTIVKSFLKGNKPQVFNIVSSPVKSKIAKSIERPENNLTGARLLVDMETQLELLSKIKNYKTIGFWFDPREKQSKVLSSRMSELMEKQGRTLKMVRVIPDSPDFSRKIGNISKEANKLDVLYVPGISSYLKHSKVLFSKLDPSLLVMGGISKLVGKGATIALAASYRERGEAAAELAGKILSGKPAGEIPISLVTMDAASLYVDRKLVKSSGLKDLGKLGLNIVEK